MSRIAIGFVGVTVSALTLGAASIQIASGHDLGPFKPNDASVRTENTIAYDVNRSSKEDRITTKRSELEGPTIVFQHPNVPSTTIAAQVRQDMPSANDTLAPHPQQDTRAKKPTKQKIAAACERNVSVLTEVAKLLDAGRCIT